MGKKRTSRRRSLRRNPLSKMQKMLVLGGVTVVGGGVAYALLRGGAATAPDTTGAAPVDPAALKAAECVAIQQELEALRARPNADRIAMQQVEARLNTCITEARALNAPVDPALAKHSDGDALKTRIDAWFDELKATDYIDVLKRGNIRGEMMRAGAAMAAAYTEAANSATSPATTRSIRQSIIRALDAAENRRLCYYYAQPRCDRYEGSTETHHKDKAAQEWSSTVLPLLDAHAAATRRFVPQAEDNVAFFEILTRGCALEKDFVDAKFAEYRTVTWDDAVRRNNLRVSEVRDRARGLVECLRRAADLAISYRDASAMRRVAAIVLAAFESSTTRWLCFALNQHGCGTFGVNEDQPDVKAAQERDMVLKPLSDLYVRLATTIVTQGVDVAAFEPFVAIKVRACAVIKDYVDVKFAEYKTVDYADAIRRNNLRQVVLGFGRLLAERLGDVTEVTRAASKLNPGGLSPSVMAAAIAAASSGASAPMFFFMPSGQPAVSGLGQLAPTMSLVPMTSSPLTTRTTAPPPLATPATAALPPPPPPVIPLLASFKAATIREFRAIAAVANAALAASVARRLCFLAQNPGCGTFGVNEASPDVKAAEEQGAVTGPLTGVCVQVAKILVDNGDANAEVPVVTERLRACNATKGYIDAKWAEWTNISWTDPLRRNNTRDAYMAAGRQMVACFREAKPTSPAALAVWRASVQAALVASQSRIACHTTRGHGCGQMHSEPSDANKVAEENRDIAGPLQALLSAPALGQAETSDGLSVPAMVGVAALIVGAAAVYSGTRRRPTRNRRKRHTSRRARIT